jgi:hypothetical protein
MPDWALVILWTITCVLVASGLLGVFQVIRSRFTGGPPRGVGEPHGSSVHGALDLGPEQFSIGTFITINHLRLFEHGGCIRTPRTNLVVKWEEIDCVGSTYTRKMTINGITGEKDFELEFNLTTGESVTIELKRLALLWGLEFLYHNAKIKRLHQVLSQHALVRMSI